MILLEKWRDLPTTYNILFPISTLIDLNWFFGVVDGSTSDSVLEDEIDGNTDLLDEVIDGGDSTDGGGETETKSASLVLVNSVNYHTYEFPVVPTKANVLYTEFELELTREIETGDYQAFFTVDGDAIATARLRIESPKEQYATYNPDRNITEYE